jgi:hypothetical protein
VSLEQAGFAHDLEIPGGIEVGILERHIGIEEHEAAGFLVVEE